MFHARRALPRLTVTIAAAIAVMAAAAVSAQAKGLPLPGTRPAVPLVTNFPVATLAAAQQVVLPQPGATPSVAATGSAASPAELFYTGSDSHLYAGPLSPLHVASQGGRLIGGPGAAFVPPGSLGGGIAFYVRGADNALWAFTGDQWVSLGGRLTSRPGTAAGTLSVTGGESIDVVARGADGAVWDREFTATTQRPWVSVGGRVLAGTGPAAVNAGGTLYVLAVGTDQALWVNKSTDGARWSGWHSLGGRVSADVGAATPAPGVAVAFARGADNAAWFNEFAGTTAEVTRGWHSLGGRLTSGVGAGSAPGGMTWALVLGTDDHIWQADGVWPTVRGWVKVL